MRRIDADRAFLETLLARIPGDPGGLSTACAGMRDWGGFVEAAARHGLCGLLHGALAGAEVGPPTHVRADLGRIAALQRLLQARLRAELDAILGALDRAGIAAVPLKGPILGERLYGDQALRVSSDLDLLVEARRLAEVEAALASRGYARDASAPVRGPRAHRHHVALLGPEGGVVELHFRLLANFGAEVPAEAFLDRAVGYRSPRGGDYRVLCAEDELVYLLAHAAAHLFERLAWLHDVKMLHLRSPGLDLGAAAARARALGLRHVYDFALATVRDRLGVAALDGTAAAGLSPIRRASATRLLRASGRLRARGLSSRVVDNLFRITLCDGLAASAVDLGRQGLRALARRRSRP